MSDIELQMPRNDDMYDWANYFIAVRRRRLQEDGMDIADDEETMHGWCCALFMMGYDKARIEQKFKEAGVETIEEYMDKLMEDAETAHGEADVE